MGHQFGWNRRSESDLSDAECVDAAVAAAAASKLCVGSGHVAGQNGERRILAALHDALSIRDVEALEQALQEAYEAGVQAMSVGFAETTLRDLKQERAHTGQY